MNNRYRHVLRALALTSITASRLAGCPFRAYECVCRGDASTANASAYEYGGSIIYNEPCAVVDLDAGCQTVSQPGGPLLPPDLA